MTPAQLQHLRRKANVTGTQYEFASGPTLISTDYDFPAQAPGGTLTATVPATVTLTPCPLGIAGANTNHYLYISGGVGAAEAVLITGGTCTSGLATGTITFTPANDHSGAWTIASASDGIAEAVYVALATGVRKVVLSPADLHVYAAVYIAPGAGLEIEGSYPGTRITLHPTNSHLFNVSGGDRFQIGGMFIQHVSPLGATAGAFINIDGTDFAKIHDVFTYYGWDIIALNNVYLCQMNSIYSQSRLHYGIKVTGTTHHTAIQAHGIQFGGSGTSPGLIGLYVSAKFQSSSFSSFVDVLSAYSVFVNIPADGYFNEVRFSDCVFDSYTAAGVVLAGSVDGTSGSVIQFVNCRVSAGTGAVNGFDINSKYSNVLISNTSLVNGAFGVLLQGAKKITISASQFDGVAATGSATGIYIANHGAAVCDNIQIVGNMIGHDASWPMVTGLGVSGHAHTNVLVANNRVRGSSADLGYYGTGSGVRFLDNDIKTGKPTADATIRGSTWYTEGAAGVADTYEVVRKDAANNYAWVALY